MTILFILLTVATILGVSLWSGRHNEGFATASGQAGSWVVAGAIIGTLVGGQATVGTAEMGYRYGFSGLWFTLGSALGCLLLLAMAGRLRRSGCSTLLEIVGRRYGHRAEVAGSLLSLFGMFFSIVAQQLACAALVRAVVPSCQQWVALVVGTLLMIVYAVGGGMMGTGRGGVVKLVLLYAAGITCGAIVVGRSHGLADFAPQQFSLLNRGLAVDLNSAFSMILGVVATQTYAQAVWAARDLRTARRGVMLSALLIPPIGVACTLVGMSQAGGAMPVAKGMAGAATAFPDFAQQNLPPWAAGIVIGTLLITVVGGASGIALGSATVAVRDLFRRPLESSGLLLLSMVVSLLLTGSLINDFGFLSLSLRAGAILIPLVCALCFTKRRISPRTIIFSMVLAIAVMLAAHFLHWPFPALLGLLAGTLPVIIGIQA